MNEHRFLNRSQPQTLYIAVILCYIALVRQPPRRHCGASSSSGIALAAGGYGIANEKKWGYSLAVGASVFQVVLLFVYFGSVDAHRTSVRCSTSSSTARSSRCCCTR